MNKLDPFYRICTYCGNEFFADHANRKFCPPPDKDNGDARRDCKITFNNLKNKSKRDKIKNISQIQYKNWVGLNEFYKKNQIYFFREDFLIYGINPELYITLSKTETGREVICFIEYGLMKCNEEKFIIIKHGLTL